MSEQDYDAQLARLGELADQLRQAQRHAKKSLVPARRGLEAALKRAWKGGRGASRPAIRAAIGNLYSMTMLDKILGGRSPDVPPRRGRAVTLAEADQLAHAAARYRQARSAEAELTGPPRTALIEALRAAWDEGRGIPKSHLRHAIGDLWTRQWVDKLLGAVPGQHGPRGWHPITKITDPAPREDTPCDR
jgi:hypothetical protein